MKVCPACRTTFDDSQNFCLNDGTPLVAAEAEPETVVVPPQSNVEYRSYQTAPNAVVPASAPKKSNTGLIVGLTALAAVLLVGLGGAAWLLMSRQNANKNDNQPIVRANTNANPSNSANAAAPRPSPTVAIATNANANVAASNSAAANAAPTNANVAENQPPPPLAVPRLSEKQTAAIRKEVSGTINSWAKAIESGDIDDHLNYYADTLDYYYNARGFSKNQVRADKQRAFENFDDIQFDISNIRVTPNETGDQATVVYDKKWNFEGAERATEGKVQSQMTLQKFGNRWLIVGERDLKVYYQQSH